MLPFRNKFGYFLRRNMYRVANLDWFDGMKYKNYSGKKLNLKDPHTWSEKLLWLNRYWQPEIKSFCADKYRVREYIEQKGLAEILIPLIGHWNNANEIDFDSLPNRFALKCNHGCGSNIICEDKASLDIDEAKRKLNKWLKTDYSTLHNEKHYSKIKPCIIGEEFLPVESFAEVVDYKIHCFNGTPRFIGVCYDRDLKTASSKGAIYSPSWERLFYLKDDDMSYSCPKPNDLHRMIQIAERLSSGFPYVRVDLYSIRDMVFFGELTFTPNGNLPDVDYTQEAVSMIGDWLDLSMVNNTK